VYLPIKNKRYTYDFETENETYIRKSIVKSFFRGSKKERGVKRRERNVQ
jgi:hypothetical protein